MPGMDDSDRTVEYRSIEYYSMCESDKARIKKMQKMGIPTPHDPKSNPEDVGTMDSIGFGLIGFERL